jgi:hypothetical protein
MLAVVDRLSLRLVPDELWALAEPLIPAFAPRPQGGGRGATASPYTSASSHADGSEQSRGRLSMAGAVSEDAEVFASGGDGM